MAGLKVLVLTNMYPHEEDQSFGTFVHEQVRYLRGMDVEIDVQFINGRANRGNYFRAIPELRRRVRENDYDLIHAHYVFSGWIGRMQRQVPLVVSFHGAAEMEGYQGWLCKRLAPRTDACIVTSHEHKRDLGYEAANVIPCGVDLDLFKPIPRQEACEQLGWDPARKVMLWVGEPRPEKRLDVIEGARDLLKPSNPDLELVKIMGTAHDKIPVYMGAADVLVLASEFEGSPVVIKEALGCNLPVVSVAVGDVADVISTAEGCFVCERTAADMAEKVDLALKNGKLKTGRDAVAHLQVNGEADRIRALYRQVTGK